MAPMGSPMLVLASGSPRRRVLLRRAGFDFAVVRPDVTEVRKRGESPEEMVARLAAAKAAIAVQEAGDDALVLGADTAVVLDGEPLGKPEGDAAAVAMLRALGGREHQVITGYSLAARGGRDQASGVEGTVVRFHPIDEAQARAYVGTGEPMDKAGAYAIQGLGRRFVAEIQGSFTNVMGLPMEVIEPLLIEHGVRPGRDDDA